MSAFSSDEEDEEDDLVPVAVAVVSPIVMNRGLNPHFDCAAGHGSA